MRRHLVNLLTTTTTTAYYTDDVGTYNTNLKPLQVNTIIIIILHSKHKYISYFIFLILIINSLSSGKDKISFS